MPRVTAFWGRNEGADVLHPLQLHSVRRIQDVERGRTQSTFDVIQGEKGPQADQVSPRPLLGRTFLLVFGQNRRHSLPFHSFERAYLVGALLVQVVSGIRQKECPGRNLGFFEIAMSTSSSRPRVVCFGRDLELLRDAHAGFWPEAYDAVEVTSVDQLAALPAEPAFDVVSPLSIALCREECRASAEIAKTVLA